MKQKFKVNGLDATDGFGRKLGSLLQPGSILLLEGEMGAGKTTLIKTICSGLGINPNIVTSPTYTFAHRYPGNLEVSHVDLFRIENPEELDDFDREELICDDGITMIEWPSLLERTLKKDHLLKLKLEVLEADCRSIFMISNSTIYDPLFAEDAFTGVSNSFTMIH
mgnify:CR=1 FL=1